MTFSFVGLALYGASRADIPRLRWQLGAVAKGAESTGLAQGGVFSRDAEVRGGWQGRQPHKGDPLCPAQQPKDGENQVGAKDMDFPAKAQQGLMAAAGTDNPAVGVINQF